MFIKNLNVQLSTISLFYITDGLYQSIKISTRIASFGQHDLLLKYFVCLVLSRSCEIGNLKTYECLVAKFFTRSPDDLVGT